jgi:hypothetical protein
MRKCSSATTILEAYSPTLYARRRWDGNGLSATRLRDCTRNQKSIHLLHIYTHTEGGERTLTVSIRAIRQETDNNKHSS